MAVNPWDNPWDQYIPPTETTHLIQGKMVIQALSLNDYQTQMMGPDEIKSDLCNGLMQYILKHKLVEFTKQTDIDTGRIHYRARMFVTPDSNVQILRLAQQTR